MMNSYTPKTYPFCGTDSFIKIGYNPNDIQRYKCQCGKKFKPTTGTILDLRKIPVSKYIKSGDHSDGYLVIKSVSESQQIRNILYV